MKYNRIEGVIVDGAGCNQTLKGGFFNFENGGTIWVNDIGEIQNSQLFDEGLHLVNTKITPKRAKYIKTIIEDFSKRNKKEVTTDAYCHFIAFICDIACHKNKKLCLENCYDKDFNKYVANLFFNYYLDDCFEVWKELGCQTECCILPELFKCA